MSSALYSPPHARNLARRARRGTGRLSCWPRTRTVQHPCGQLNARHLLLHRARASDSRRPAACGRSFRCCSPARCAAGALGISFAGDPYVFLQKAGGCSWSCVALVLVLRAAAAHATWRRRSTSARRTAPEPFAAALAGIGLGAGARAVRRHARGAPRRLVARPDRRPAARPALAQRGRRPGHRAGPRCGCPTAPAREALTIYLDAAALLVAALSASLYPLGYVAVGAAALAGARRRAPRSAEKYAGLRILRR